MTDRRGSMLAAVGVVCLPGLFVLAAATPVRALANTAVACDPAALITAITNANNASGGTLDLAAGCTYAFTAADNTTDNPGTATPVISTPITINGNGAHLTRNGGGIFRAFDVATAGALTLNDTTVTGFWADAAILDQGALVLTGDSLTLNSFNAVSQTTGATGMTVTNTVMTSNYHFGIYTTSPGVDTLVSDTLQGNVSWAFEQGPGAGALNATNTSFSGNWGGVYNGSNAATDTLTGDTLHGNALYGVISYGPLMITSTTIDMNSIGVLAPSSSTTSPAVTLVNATLTTNYTTDVNSSGGAAISGTTISGQSNVAVSVRGRLTCRRTRSAGSRAPGSSAHRARRP